MSGLVFPLVLEAAWGFFGFRVERLVPCVVGSLFCGSQESQNANLGFRLQKRV